MTLHPAIRLASATHLGAPPPDDTPAAEGPTARARAAARHAAGRVLDRVGDRAAAATAGQVEQLRDELERTRAELMAEIELLRAELEARDRP
ncbi:hypothetical protein PO878_13450 [Iamia majanohamensis]|uniref:Uncharacterized protein n=1 Tax=Iamia majanohamensis TaxID=467976 RepID=A0AAE9Y6Y8_9ACTN|nr:hypothetical protein [Iamia majanohamensis]WCO65503.1 hypothetical protein PO878_13450 [Iamia majanohamensis]